MHVLYFFFYGGEQLMDNGWDFQPKKMSGRQE